MDKKVCTQCGEEKELSEFYKQKKKDENGQEYFYYHPECKECTKKRSAKWNDDNREHAKELRRKYDMSEKRKISDEKRKDKISVMQKKWRKANAEYMRNYNQKRRSGKKGLLNTLTEKEWQECLIYFNHECAYCGISEEEFLHKENKHLSQEHFIPYIKGGEYTKENIIPSCQKCNNSKYDKDFFEWYRKQDFYSEEKEVKILLYLGYEINTENKLEGWCS